MIKLRGNTLDRGQGLASIAFYSSDGNQLLSASNAMRACKLVFVVNAATGEQVELKTYAGYGCGGTPVALPAIVRYLRRRRRRGLR